MVVEATAREVWPTLVAITSPLWAAPKARWLNPWDTIWRLVHQGTSQGLGERLAPLSYQCAQYVWEDGKTPWLERRVAGGKQRELGGAWYTVGTRETLCQCLWECAIVGWECDIHTVREALHGGHQCLALKHRATRESSTGARQNESAVQGRSAWWLTGFLTSLIFSL